MNTSAILQSPAKKHWETMGIRHHHGVCLPLSALHDRETGGIGDFGCLPAVIDWLAAIGMDILQLLPINDTGSNSSPYSLHSAFALNPVYLDVTPYAGRSDRKMLESLNGLEWVSYRRARKAKLSILWNAFHKKNRQKTAKAPWLNAYVRWMGAGDPVMGAFYLFLQRLCFSQMRQVRRYAESKGVWIKGDLPILISPSSIDCKEHSELFAMDLSVGAPPDSFSANGQNWGFPAYRYEEKLAEIEHWWEQRLQTAQELYHLYRLDHAVGFFRLWVVEKGKSAKHGFYIPNSSRKWKTQGVRLLTRFLHCSTMLPVAEDLGSVPPMVKRELSKLGIPGTKVMRWENKRPQFYPEISMTTVSTHDTETFKQWWSKYPEESRALCRSTGMSWKKKPSKELLMNGLKLSHGSGSLLHINLLQEYFPLADSLSWPRMERERINVPGGTRRRNWTYKFRPSITEFTQNHELAAAMKQLLSSSS